MIVSELPTHKERYFAWIVERQAIWHRRMIELRPAPWTDDPILRDFRFTNAYRALDRGTIYSRQVVMKLAYDHGTPFQRLRHLFMRVLTYRTFNRVETFDKVFRPLDYYTYAREDPKYHDWTWDDIRASLEDLHTREPVFTRAHVVATFGARKGENTKIEKVVEFLQTVEGMLDDLVGRLVEVGKGRHGFIKAYELLQEIPHVGEFLAYEILCDLCYSFDIDFDEDSWAHAGPGAREGLKLLFPDRFPGERDEALMRELQKEQFEMYHSKGWLLWHYAPLSTPYPYMSLRDIEGGLCEYYKYNTIVEGKLANRLPFQLGQGYRWK